MKIKSLTIQNVFLFGNNKQTINFENLSDSNESTLNILIGKNGHGKSSLINCLKLGLYFDKVPINVSEISNDINGNGYIKIDLESFNSVWSIESNYTKTSLKSIEITKDGKPIDIGKIPETKKYIYERIIDIEYHIFSNIISLSMNDFKSFISMTPKDTRLIRDRIFGFYILNEMNEQNKNSIKEYVDRLVKNNTKKEFIEQEIEKLKSSLQSDERITELENEIKKLEKTNEEKTVESGKKVSEIEVYQKKYDIALKYIEYLANEVTKANIKEQEQELESIKTNIQTLQNSEKKTVEEIDNILSDIQIYYKKNSLKQYTEYTNQLTELQKKSKEQSEKVLKIKSEYQDLLNKKIFSDFNDIIDKAIADFELIKETRNSYVREINIINELTSQYNELIELRDTEQGNHNLKKECIKTNNHFIKLYEDGKCPTCETLFTNADYEAKIVQLKEDNEKIEQELPIIQKSIDTKNETILTVNDNIEKSKRKTIELKLNLKLNINIENEIKDEKYNIIDEQTRIKLASQYRYLNDYLNTEQIIEFGKDDEILANLKIKSYDNENLDLDTKKIELDKVDKEFKETTSKQQLYQEEIDKFDKSKIEEINKLKFNLKEITSENVIEHETKVEKLKKESSEKLITSELERKQTIELDIEKLKLGLINDETHFQDSVKEYNGTTAEDINSKLEEIKSKLDIASEENTIITDEISRNIQTINTNKLIITNNKELMTKKMNEYNEQIEEVIKDYKIINTSLTFLKIIEYSLSDKGVKSFIIAKIIPYINHSVNAILNQFDIPLSIKFDDEFKPIIYRFGNEVSHRTISLGQSKMIDYSIICTIIKFIKNKCIDLNVVFLDEIFSSLHVSMLPIILEITKKEIVENLSMDVFLVNHSLISRTFFENSIEVVYDNNFSTIIMTKANAKEEDDNI